MAAVTWRTAVARTSAAWYRGRAALAKWPWAELLAGGCLVGGWCVLTAAAVAWWGHGRAIALTSAGGFLLSLFGWKVFYVIVRDGLYALTRDGRNRRR